MQLKKLDFIYNQFKKDGHLISCSPLTSGHINDTFIIENDKHEYFVIQKINKNVFKDVAGLINNKVLISKHLQKKYSHLSECELKRRVLCFVETKNDSNYYKDEHGNFWNLMIYISNSVTFETVKDEEIAYEGGKLMGNFLNLTQDFDYEKLIEVIPNFHDMSFRFCQFQDALQSASKERLKKAITYIELVRSLKEEMHIIQNLKESGELKIRVTHNDTKISNILFDTNKKGLCVIDTDTVMPGIIHYDFGDAIRTICNTAAEDETDLSKVSFNINFYKAYVKGFLEELQSDLSPLAIECLPLSAKTMIFIMALRFLTDYLNNDMYYKTSYPSHNLDRAKNQFKLLESLTLQYGEVELFKSAS